MPEKRQALVDLLEEIFTDHSEDFIVYQRPITAMMRIGSRAERRDIQENSSGEVRHCEVYFDGPDAPDSVEEGNNVMRNDGTQHGSIDAFRVVLWYGMSEDGNGNIDSFAPWESLLTAYDPMGILPTIRERRSLEPTVNGTPRMVYLGVPRNIVYPNVPRSLEGSGEERAHYMEFLVSITDA